MNVEEIILKNHNLIYLVLKQLNLYSKLDEYYDIAVIGLVKGAKAYNPSLNFKESTYLCKCIKRELLHEIKKQSCIKRGHGYLTLSLDSEEYSTKEGTTSSLLNSIPNDVCIEDDFIKSEKLKAVYKCIETLSPRERFVISSAYELNGFKHLTQKELSKQLKCSQAQVSRIRSKALSKIKEKMKEW